MLEEVPAARVVGEEVEPHLVVAVVVDVRMPVGSHASIICGHCSLIHGSSCMNLLWHCLQLWEFPTLMTQTWIRRGGGTGLA